MKFCPTCGKEWKENAKFCVFCGAKGSDDIVAPTLLPNQPPVMQAQTLSTIEALDLGMIENFKQCILNRYIKFEGRACRAEYWRFGAVQSFAGGVLGLLALILGDFGYVLGVLWNVGILLPSISVMVRRLHDINKSGWFCWIILIPIVGVIWLIVLMAKRGDEGPNTYGERTGYTFVTEDIKTQYKLADTTQSDGVVAVVAVVGAILQLITK